MIFEGALNWAPMPRDASLSDSCSTVCSFLPPNKINQLVLLFDDNRIKMARKSGKKQKENPVGFTGEGKR